MKRALNCIALVYAFVALSSCAHTDKTEKTECDYYAIARAEITKHEPNYPLDARVMTHREHLTFVEVFYRLPEGAIGGGPIVKIRKANCTVKDITFWQ